MHRIYCDSNIYRLIKPEHPFYQPKLLDALEDLKDKLLFIFSDAHLDDLSDAVEHMRDHDLEVMGRYVANNYFALGHTPSKGRKSWLQTPSQAFGLRNFGATRKFESKPFDFDELFPEDTDDPFLSSINRLAKTYFDMPLAALAPALMHTEIDPVGKQWIDKIIPGYSPLMSIREMMEKFSPYAANLINDHKELTSMRKSIREYIDRDTYSFDQWGMQFDEQFKQAASGKTFLETVDESMGAQQKNDLHHRFVTAYTLLEVYNVTQERKSGGGLKKFNYRSLHRDAEHAYFASFCDYLVTDDRGLQAKAYILYRLFNIPTKILSIQDFTKHKSEWMMQEETIGNLIPALRADLENGVRQKSKYFPEYNTLIKNSHLSHDYFNYFNRLQLIQGKTLSLITLYCDRQGQGNFVTYNEIKLMIGKLQNMFGQDVENKGEWITEDQKIANTDECIRQWQIADVGIMLKYRLTDIGFSLSLVFDLYTSPSRQVENQRFTRYNTSVD